MATLREKIEIEMDNISKILAELAHVEDVSTLSPLELAGVATYLHNVYNGVENILKYSMFLCNQKIPISSTWHRDLLNSTVRHQIISPELNELLAELMSFRHFFIHAYGFQLDYSAIKSLTDKIHDVYSKFEEEIKSFLAGFEE